MCARKREKEREWERERERKKDRDRDSDRELVSWFGISLPLFHTENLLDWIFILSGWSKSTMRQKEAWKIKQETWNMKHEKM